MPTTGIHRFQGEPQAIPGTTARSVSPRPTPPAYALGTNACTQQESPYTDDSGTPLNTWSTYHATQAATRE